MACVVFHGRQCEVRLQKKEEKRQGFVTYCEVFIVGLHDIAMHVWNIRIVYVLMDSNVEIKGN
jgi:hypothetical protein